VQADLTDEGVVSAMATQSEIVRSPRHPVVERQRRSGKGQAGQLCDGTESHRPSANAGRDVADDGSGGCIVFVTSHLAHFYGRKPVYAAYEGIAASKKAGEDALRSRMPEFEARGLRWRS